LFYFHLPRFMFFSSYSSKNPTSFLFLLVAECHHIVSWPLSVQELYKVQTLSEYWSKNHSHTNAQKSCNGYWPVTKITRLYHNWKTVLNKITLRTKLFECAIVYAQYVRGDQIGLFKLVTLNCILNCITGVTFGCWWLVVVNAIPTSDICQINQQNIPGCSVINNRNIKFS
jgi:hypothetical protein